MGYLRGGWFLVSADTVYSSMGALDVDMGMCNAMYDFREACKQTTKTVSGKKINLLPFTHPLSLSFVQYLVCVCSEPLLCATNHLEEGTPHRSRRWKCRTYLLYWQSTQPRKEEGFSEGTHTHPINSNPGTFPYPTDPSTSKSSLRSAVHSITA